MSVVTSSLLPDPVPRRHDEEQLGRSVAQFLRVALPHDATFTHIPLGGQRHSKAAARLAGMGTKAGFPDYLIVHRGRALFIEIKTQTGHLSAVQRQMIDKLRVCGADVMVCRSLPCVQEALLELGVPLKATVAA